MQWIQLQVNQESMIFKSHGSSNTLHLFADLLCLKKKIHIKKTRR